MTYTVTHFYSRIIDLLLESSKVSYPSQHMFQLFIISISSLFFFQENCTSRFINQSGAGLRSTSFKKTVLTCHHPWSNSLADRSGCSGHLKPLFFKFSVAMGYVIGVSIEFVGMKIFWSCFAVKWSKPTESESFNFHTTIY